MGRKDAVFAYRDSIYDAAEYSSERRLGERTLPIVGGMWSALKQVGNLMWRPIKVTGAFIIGYPHKEREFPQQPEVPEVFQGSSLGQAFNDSWKLKEEAAKARVEGFAKLMDLEITSWWQKASIASHAEARDTHVVFPEEGIARNQAAAGSGFVAALGSRSGSEVGR